MKKVLSVILLFVLLISLCACGSTDAAKDITIDDLIGTWHCEQTQQVIILNTSNATLFQYPISIQGTSTPPKIEKKQLVVPGMGTFDIQNDTGALKIVCTATEMVAANTVFEKCEETITLDEITAHSWTSPTTGSILTFENGMYTHTDSSGSSFSFETQYTYLAGDTYYLPDVDIFKIVEDGESFKLVGKTWGEYLTLDAAAAKAASELINMGETAKTELFEITAKEYTFAELLGKDNTTKVFTRDVSWDDAGDGKVFMIVKFDYLNLDKREVDLVRDLCITVSYKDGFEFASFEEDKGYLFEDDINGVFRRTCLDSGGYVMALSPLTSGSFFVAIPVAEVVSTDAESPISVRFDYGENIKGGASISETVYIKVQ